ncbi:MAG: glycosyltransferase [Pseudomonadota bacterium]
MTASPSGPTITLIITSYRQLAFLRQALASATGQTCQFHQIIVVEDGSGDETIPYLRAWANQHDNAEVVFHPENLGLSTARNTGLARVKGDYVAFLDGDDLLRPDACEKMHALLAEKTPDMVLFNMDYVQTDGDGVAPAKPRKRMFSKSQADDTGFPRHMAPPSSDLVSRMFWFHPTAWQKLQRAEFLRDIGVQFSGPIYEDIAWHFETIFRARSVSYMTDKLVQYRLHDKSALSTPADRHMHIFDQYDRVSQFIEDSGTTDRDILDAYRRFRFVHLSFVGARSGRVPEPLRRGYAERVLALPTLTAFEMSDDENELLSEVQALTTQHG